MKNFEIQNIADINTGTNKPHVIHFTATQWKKAVAGVPRVKYNPKKHKNLKSFQIVPGQKDVFVHFDAPEGSKISRKIMKDGIIAWDFSHELEQIYLHCHLAFDKRTGKPYCRGGCSSRHFTNCVLEIIYVDAPNKPFEFFSCSCKTFRRTPLKITKKS